MVCSINSPVLCLMMKHLVIGQRLKSNFSAFHWSPRGNLVSIGQHFVATRVVHLPKSTETSLITESDQSGPNHQLLQLCTARIAWSDSDQSVRAVHSCNSWFLYVKQPNFESCFTVRQCLIQCSMGQYGKTIRCRVLTHFSLAMFKSLSCINR